ncbi:hypothetical protein Tco_0470268, partial [Tanacetum coccineum]
MFTDNITKVDSEPPNGSNGDITNPYECDQTLNVNACTTNSSAAEQSFEVNPFFAADPEPFVNVFAP